MTVGQRRQEQCFRTYYRRSSSAPRTWWRRETCLPTGNWTSSGGQWWRCGSGWWGTADCGGSAWVCADGRPAGWGGSWAGCRTKPLGQWEQGPWRRTGALCMVGTTPIRWNLWVFGCNSPSSDFPEGKDKTVLACWMKSCELFPYTFHEMSFLKWIL